MQRPWHRFDIRQIEDLANAVLGAELEVVQMAGPAVCGSLAFAACNGVVFSSGWIRGNVAISGPLSHDAISIGVGLRVGAGSRLWLKTIRNGDVGVFPSGNQHDGLYLNGVLYLTATLTAERLAQIAAREGLPLDPTLVSRPGLHIKSISPRIVAQLRREMARIHAGGVARDERPYDVGFVMLRDVIAHFAKVPQGGDQRLHPPGLALIAGKARDYIRANLADSFAMETLAIASGTSQRSLARAFAEIWHDTPGSYVRRLRLHRIRHDLVVGRQKIPVSQIAERWGIREPGRMSGWYRELFGELPTETRARTQLRNLTKDRLL